MDHVKEMIHTHPARSTIFDEQALVTCLKACHECASSCGTCADACLSERNVQQLVPCIRFNLDCADVCEATGRLLARASEASLDVLRAQLLACREACRACGAECQRHAGHHEHCRVCAEACNACADACDRLLS